MERAKLLVRRKVSVLENFAKGRNDKPKRKNALWLFMVLRAQQRVPGIKKGSTACKANT